MLSRSNHLTIVTQPKGSAQVELPTQPLPPVAADTIEASDFRKLSAGDNEIGAHSLADLNQLLASRSLGGFKNRKSRTNNIEDDSEWSADFRKLLLERLYEAGIRPGYPSLAQPEARQTRPRTVESPALSVDSGGRSSGATIAGEISKILNVKQGHYSEIYNRIDGQVPLSTRKPAEVIEDTMRQAVQSFFHHRHNHNNHHQRHEHRN